MSASLNLQDVPIRSVQTWQDRVGEAFFELDVRSPGGADFSGELQCWEAADFGLALVRCSAVLYSRRRDRCLAGDGRILVTVPLDGEIRFAQFKREARCEPGSFVLEASDEPYELAQGAATLLVLRASEAALRDRLRDPRRFAATGISLRHGLGRLFGEFLQLSMPHVAHDPQRLLPLLGPQFLDLLAAALEDQSRAAGSSMSAVRAAHLARIDAYVGRHLCDPDLSLDQVAAGCGVSLRYLHALFHEAGSTGRQWIRDRRLRLAHDLLAQPARGASIADLAYRVGFSDHAQFSRAFRAKFGFSPRDLRDRAAAH